jgi:hypothetical protein
VARCACRSKGQHYFFAPQQHAFRNLPVHIRAEKGWKPACRELGKLEKFFRAAVLPKSSKTNCKARPIDCRYQWYFLQAEYTPGELAAVLFAFSTQILPLPRKAVDQLSGFEISSKDAASHKPKPWRRSKVQQIEIATFQKDHGLLRRSKVQQLKR